MKGPILTEFLDHRQITYADQYWEILKRLLAAIKAKRPGMLSLGAILLHNNARPHTATSTHSMLARFWCCVLELPLYSPEFSRCDFHIFGSLNKVLKCRRFHSDSEVIDSVRNWFQSQSNSFYERGFHRLVEQLDKWLWKYGDHLKKINNTFSLWDYCSVSIWYTVIHIYE